MSSSLMLNPILTGMHIVMYNRNPIAMTVQSLENSECGWNSTQGDFLRSCSAYLCSTPFFWYPRAVSCLAVGRCCEAAATFSIVRLKCALSTWKEGAAA